MRCLATLLLVSAAAFAQRQTENVLLVTLDGLRWQDVFTGADNRMINQPDGGVRDLRQLRREFYRGAPEVRRALLMPFLWGVVAPWLTVLVGISGGLQPFSRRDEFHELCDRLNLDAIIEPAKA